MKKDDVLKFIEEKGDTSFIIRTEDDDKKFLENYGKSVLEKELDPAISKIHTQYDDDLEKIFGKRKKPGEKTYNFMKSEFQSWKEKAERAAELESEIAELKKGSPDDATRLKEIKALQDELKRMKDDHTKEIEHVRRSNDEMLIRKDIQKAVAGIKRKPGIPDVIWESYIEKISDDLIKNAEIRDGKTVFLDAEKKALRNKATMAEYTAEEIILERLPKDVIDTGRKVNGPGLKEEKGKPDTTNVLLPDTVTSRQKLGTYLSEELGIKSTTEEYRKLYAELGKDLPAFDKK